MNLKKLSNNSSGIVDIVYIAVVLGIAVVAGSITLFLTNQVLNTTGTIPGSAATNATGTVTFSGNVSNGEAVNLTDPSGFKYIFEFNTTDRGALAQDTCYVYRTSGGCIPVNVSYNMGWNNSFSASGNLTATINANTTVHANVTAVNTTNRTSLSALAGTPGNSMILSDNALNVTVSGLSGGSNQTSSGVRLQNSQNNLLTTIETGYSFLPIVAVAAIGVIAIAYVFGLIPGLGRKGGGGGMI